MIVEQLLVARAATMSPGALAARRSTTVRISAVLLACAFTHPIAYPLAAQDVRATNERERADVLVERGQLFAAESVYYAAVRTRPKDPWARLNLARHVMARGAAKVASALYEEARFFGADPRLFAGELAFAYERAGMWRALAAMPGAPLPRGEMRRAEWMLAHVSATRGVDTVEVPWVPVRGDTITLAAIGATIGNDSAILVVDPVIRGVVVDTAWLRRPGVRIFGNGSNLGAFAAVAVIDSVAIGGMLLTNVPARVAPLAQSRGVLVGMDWLGDRAATFDPARGRIALVRMPGDPRAVRGARVPTVFTRDGLCLVLDGLVPIAGTGATTVFGLRRWTVLGVRGEIALAP